MDIIIVLVFISLTLVVAGLVFFFSRLFEGDFEHGDRLSLLPLEDDDGMNQVDPENPDDKKMLAYLGDAKEMAEKKLETGPDRGATNIMINYALVIEKDADKAVAAKLSSMPEGWKDEAGSLNEFTWWCFENKVNLDQAEELSRKGVKLAAAGREKSMIMDKCRKYELNRQ